MGSDLPKRDYDVEHLPEFDTAFRDRMRQSEADTRRSAWEQERADRNERWWKQYEAYRQSQHWQQLRRRVIARDGFRCQNCFCRVTDGSAHVHHLSYDGFNAVGHSFAFECVTLCRTCHEDYHPHMQSTRHTPPVMEVTW